MCGIVGYVGQRSTAQVVLGGLARLEYRGYDSAGIAIITPGNALVSHKRAGKLSVLRDDLATNPLLDGTTGIGHTRWATHGPPTDNNAHPHLGDEGKLALIHNGIIENYELLKRELVEQGETFHSDTDSEVVALMLGREYRDTHDVSTAMQRVVARLEGAFTLLAVHANQPGVVVGARRNSPLVVGLGEGENFLGSDVAAFVAYTDKAMAVGQDQIVTITPDSVTVVDFEGKPANATPFTVDWDASAADKGGWSSFMAKEISEEPEAVANTLRGRVGAGGIVTLPELDAVLGDSVSISRIIFIACGTAAYASMLGAYAIEKWSGIPATVELSHEFRYRDPVVDASTLIVSVSQSGETMDTLMAVRYAKEKGATTLSICNTQGATIARESDAVLYTYAGPEVAVASTKAFLSQVVATYLLGLYLGQHNDRVSAELSAQLAQDFEDLPDQLEEMVQTGARIKELAGWMADTRSVLFLGRHVGYPVALEGALKLKELAYIHAEGFAAGELKHGPIALIEPGQIVFVVVPSPRDPSSLHAKVVSNIQEIRARGARVIAIAEKADAAVLPHADEVIAVPFASTFMEPLLAVVPLHIFGMELAAAKGLDIDQPRNLAKSVTVE
ncbi:MAG: glutamine amidotransferase [Microbacteriaceae bacterium BACL25 MAG-120322-bin65]|jgi:glutamine---fructose-6-phosphate transaminase (isomerizing)|nr:MAG: glutamine amidotransferase [Microbacteriaceae bacterium BACL25 MAG-120322-bin65]HAA79274.1 glutamine--fructose-6-phosphate transaminase (isomerizing) [Microbacteriaceae bacterium]